MAETEGLIELGWKLGFFGSVSNAVSTHSFQIVTFGTFLSTQDSSSNATGCKLGIASGRVTCFPLSIVFFPCAVVFSSFKLSALCVLPDSLFSVSLLDFVWTSLWVGSVDEIFLLTFYILYD